MSKQIPLSQRGKHKNKFFAIVDDDLYDQLASVRWTYHKGYVSRDVSYRKVFMEQVVLGFPDSEIDHINRNPLDNRRGNLRLCTRSQNSANHSKQRNNSSGFIGVSFRPKQNKWVAYLGDGPDRYIGFFDTNIDAARARDTMAKERYGEFASLNFPDDNS